MEMQAEMFNRMCSVTSSDINFDKLECKDIENESETVGLFNNHVWENPDLGSSKRDYGVNIFQNSYDKSNNQLSNDNL